ncbi:MAG: 5-(carboxyamino)imidazole ribonucleotide synthase [Bacteroidetes bacterium]|nr:5-(carboxyamino)imidazole ribonucleotide synthase [Bacteroidota bacterium]
MLPSEKRIGIIGGGQLGKMMSEAGSPWIIKYNFLDAKGSPCSLQGGTFIEGSLKSAEDIRKLAEISDVLTYEIEHINTEAIAELEKEGKQILPKPSVLKIINDKGIQNEYFEKHNIPIPVFCNLKEEKDWTEKLELFRGEKIVVKSRKGGYDGKGVEILTKQEIIDGARPFDTENTLLEQFVEDITEISVIVAVDQHGNSGTYPPVAMEFDPVSNLVMFLHTEVDMDRETLKRCREIAEKSALSFKSPGLFAVELFVKDGEVMVNEIAPRPHNSGHHTIEACYTSQFEQLNRILLGMNLGNTELICPGAMINIVGPEDFSGKYQLEIPEELSKEAGFFIHLYGKTESRPHRKLGHITILAKDKTTLFEKADKARKIKVIAK